MRERRLSVAFGDAVQGGSDLLLAFSQGSVTALQLFGALLVVQFELGHPLLSLQDLGMGKLRATSGSRPRAA